MFGPDIAKPCRQRGFGLLETMLLLGLLTIAVICGYLYIHYTETARMARQQEALLQQADRQVKAFALDNARLPCPDTDNDGVEDCSSGAVVGRLPYKTLGLDGAQINSGVNQLRYQVARTTNDLAVTSDAFEPHDWEGTAYSFSQTNGTDFCTTVLANAAAGVTRAYAIASPGAVDADGDGSPFDGDNTSSSALDSATRAASPSYDDHVISISPSELALRSGCAMVNDSLNGIALGVDVINEVEAQKEETAGNVEQSISDTEIQLAIQTYSIALGAADIAIAASELVTAISEEAAAVAACVASLGTACGLVAYYTAAVVASGIAVGLTVAAEVVLAASYIEMFDVLSEYNTLAEKLGAETTTVDSSSTSDLLNSAAESAAQSATNAYNNYLAAEEQAEEALATATTDKAVFEASVTVYDTTEADEAYTSAGIADYMAAAETAAEEYAAAQAAESTAQGNYDSAKEAYDGLVDSGEDVDADTLASYKQDVDDAEAVLESAEETLATKKAAYDAAESDLTTALATLDACKTDTTCTTTVSGYLDTYESAYEAYLVAKTDADSEYSTYETAQTQAESAAEAAAAFAVSGSTSASAIAVFSGSEDILEAADAKGTAQ